MAERVLMTADDIRRALTRIAHEILEHNKGTENMVLVGVRSRGVPLAHRLASLLQSLEGRQIPLGELDITLYRDDWDTRDPQPMVRSTEIPVDITDKRIILVDDVLYTGRSVRAALDAIIDFGRPESIQLAVLVDRGHRELPVRADYVGKNIPTALDEMVEVQLVETDGRDEVTLVRTEG